MEREIKCQCKNCKEVLTEDNCVFGAEDGDLIPVIFAETIEKAKKIYEKFYGETYEEMIGNKFEDDFEKGFYPLTHLSEDEIYDERFKEHTFGLIECWSNI